MRATGTKTDRSSVPAPPLWNEQNNGAAFGLLMVARMAGSYMRATISNGGGDGAESAFGVGAFIVDPS